MMSKIVKFPFDFLSTVKNGCFRAGCAVVHISLATLLSCISPAFEFEFFKSFTEYVLNEKIFKRIAVRMENISELVFILRLFSPFIVLMRTESFCLTCF